MPAWALMLIIGVVVIGLFGAFGLLMKQRQKAAEAGALGKSRSFSPVPPPASNDNNKKVKVTIVEPGGAKKQKSFRGNACEGEALTSSQMSEESVELTRFSDTKKMQRESL